jgi:hypothetical protein
MAIAEMELELRQWLDRLAIQDLIVRWSDGVTRAAWDQCESLVDPEVVWEIPALGLRYENRSSLLEFLRGADTGGVMIQTPHASVIDLKSPDQAKATTTVHEFIRGEPDTELNNFEAYGIYFDEVARTGGEWKFTHRLYVLHYVGPGRVTGDVLTPRSQLSRGD